MSAYGEIEQRRQVFANRRRARWIPRRCAHCHRWLPRHRVHLGLTYCSGPCYAALYPATQFQDAGDEYVAWTPPPAESTRALRAHITHVRYGYGRYRVECTACPFWEFYEDESTAHREAQRHEITSRSGESGAER